jgi:hypothetical protein
LPSAGSSGSKTAARSRSPPVGMTAFSPISASKLLPWAAAPSKPPSPPVSPIPAIGAPAG